MRLLVIEDDPVLQRTLAAALREENYAVDTASDGAEGLFKAQQNAYDAVLLDIMLPKLDGWGVLTALRPANRTPVLMLTARDTVPDRIRGLDAGADDYLVKPYDPDELLARLRAVERRRSGVGSATLQLQGLSIDLARMVVTLDGQPVEITAKEWALLRVMALRPDRIHTRESLQDALYGLDADASSNTLEVFISNLRRKIGRDRIQTLRGLGYKLNTSA